MSSVPPARSTRVGALDSMRMGSGRERLLGRASRTGNAITDQERMVFFFLGLLGIGFEAAAAAGFVHAGGADDDQLFTLEEALGVHRGIAAAHANGEQLSDFFGDGEKAGHRLEGAAAIISVEAGDDDALAEISELGADVHDFVAEELRFVDADDFGARLDFFHDFRGFVDAVGRDPQAGVRDDFVGSVALVDGGLEDLHALARKFRAAQAADQLFAFAGKHRADDDLDPAHIALDNVHRSLLVYNSSVPYIIAQRRPRGTFLNCRRARRPRARRCERLPGG